MRKNWLLLTYLGQNPQAVPLFIMNVNIGQGLKKTLKFWYGQESTNVAKNFCKKWNIDSSAIPFLTELLEARKKESLKNYQSPNILVSKIAFPENPEP